MAQTHRKYAGFVVCIQLFLNPFPSKAQEAITTQLPLIELIQKLEIDFNIKFSYVDKDLQTFRVTMPTQGDLDEVLEAIENQTPLKVNKLNERYYTLSKSVTAAICAQVLDNYENNTIIGASVEVLGHNHTTITDAKGQFTLMDVPREATLRIRYVGYKVKYISVASLENQDPCNVVLMAPLVQQLDEVVVSHFLTSGLVKNEDGSIAMNTERFGILPGLIEPDVLQTVQALPGIKSIDETVSDINVRGGTNDQNLILWDGIKMYQSGHFFGLISAFNPYLVDKVSIIKNGTSAQYGDGVSSVISMETKDKVTDQFFGGGGFNMISGDVFGQVPLSPNLAIQLSARRSLNDVVNTPTYNQFFDRAFQDTEIAEANNASPDIRRKETFYFYDFTGKILYDLTRNHKLRVSFITMNNRLDYEETQVANNDQTQSQLVQENLSFGGSLASRWSNDFSTEIQLYYTYYNLDAQNNFENVQQLFQNNEILETAVKLNTNYRLSSSLNWLNGYQMNEVGITNFTNVTQPPFNSNIKGVIRTHALYSEVGYESPNKKLIARSGTRINYIENKNTFTKVIVEPRLTINYNLLQNLHLEVLGEFKNQTTNQIIDLKQNFLGIEKRRWILSDDATLPITRSKQGSVGLTYDKNNLYVGLEGFYKYVNGISTATQGFQNQDQFNGEIGSYEVKGLEFLVNKKTALMSTWLSYAYNVNTYNFNTITPNRFPNNLDIKHTVTFASTYTYNNLKLGLGFNYRTGRPFTKPLEGDNALNTNNFPNTINFATPNSSRVSDYLRLDASAVYKFQLSSRIKANVGASVLNVLDRKNILNTFFRLNNNNQIETVQNVSLGFTPNASFRVSF
ncbi:carboxypeptidase-like regulatory domain-containing protein [Arenibacter sp. GZD96]|uniref:TonB-dependent receptor n=1 Tax=Aurantibrevibacter litoralis TaxID=3106030 RepID=UPI002AFFE38F|nr:carboxypeptidase-like regulatory domain-containing protein [Arenibacter sp. GZD-96]MEA1785854.1 carboxypeptidase-like regulatory domain-containing protein [Arenibacter sp. GZD-96]